MRASTRKPASIHRPSFRAICQASLLLLVLAGVGCKKETPLAMATRVLSGATTAYMPVKGGPTVASMESALASGYGKAGVRTTKFEVRPIDFGGRQVAALYFYTHHVASGTTLVQMAPWRALDLVLEQKLPSVVVGFGQTEPVLVTGGDIQRLRSAIPTDLPDPGIKVVRMR